MVIAHRLVLAAWDEAPSAFASAALAPAAGQPRLLVLLEAAVKPFHHERVISSIGGAFKSHKGPHRHPRRHKPVWGAYNMGRQQRHKRNDGRRQTEGYRMLWASGSQSLIPYFSVVLLFLYITICLTSLKSSAMSPPSNTAKILGFEGETQSTKVPSHLRATLTSLRKHRQRQVPNRCPHRSA